jgi:hypothetical protein
MKKPIISMPSRRGRASRVHRVSPQVSLTPPMNHHQIIAIVALTQMKGDDLARSRSAFRSLDEREMNQPLAYLGGKTPAQIIAKAESREAEIDAAIAWLKSL